MKNHDTVYEFHDDTSRNQTANFQAIVGFHIGRSRKIDDSLQRRNAHKGTKIQKLWIINITPLHSSLFHYRPIVEQHK
jgi:hypothetical protein